jgi:hypothetical protein
LDVDFPHTRRTRGLRRRLGWGGVVVNVGFLGVIARFVFLRVVVAVRQLAVIVRVGVPVGTMLEFVAEPTLVMVADVPVVVCVRRRFMRVSRCLAFALSSLIDRLHRSPPLRATNGNALPFGYV